MEILTFKSSPEMGLAAAQHGADAIKHAIAANGAANIILATGASQFEMLKQLVRISDIHWPAVTAFHLDEYLGLPETHPASFRKYLRERFVAHVPALKKFYFVNGKQADPRQECARLGAIIQQHPIDVAFVGIGENGHLAFNDPPADFETETPYIVVTLDDACRRQQLGEGWFKTLDEVPQRAISMSIRQILKSRCVLVTVPDKRKARAVHCTVAGDVSKLCPASILQTHPNCTLFLDAESASLLPEVTGS